MGKSPTALRLVGEPPTHPQRISSKHRALMRELVSGRNQKEAAEAVGFTPERVTQLMGSELFRAELEELQRKVDRQFAEAEGMKQSVEYHRDVLRTMVPDALEALKDGVNCREDPRLRFMSAKDILDRSGLKEAERLEVRASFQADSCVLSLLETVKRELHGGVLAGEEDLPDGHSDSGLRPVGSEGD